MCINDACRWDLFVRTSNTTTTSNEQTKKSCHEKGNVYDYHKTKSKPNITILTWCDYDCDCSKGSMGNGQLQYPHFKWHVFLYFGCEWCELNLFLSDDTFGYMKQLHHHFNSNAFWFRFGCVMLCVLSVRLVCVGEANSKQTFDYKNIALKSNGEYNELSSPTNNLPNIIHIQLENGWFCVVCSIFLHSLLSTSQHKWYENKNRTIIRCLSHMNKLISDTLISKDNDD